MIRSLAALCLFVGLSAQVVAEYSWWGVSGAGVMGQVSHGLVSESKKHLYPGVKIQIGRAFSLGRRTGLSVGLDGLLLSGTGDSAGGQTSLKYGLGVNLYPWYQVSPHMTVWLSTGLASSRVNFTYAQATDKLDLSGALVGFGASWHIQRNAAIVLNMHYAGLKKKSVVRSGASHNYQMNQSLLALGYAKFF